MEVTCTGTLGLSLASVQIRVGTVITWGNGSQRALGGQRTGGGLVDGSHHVLALHDLA
jgi:hypothetical protein